MKLMPVSLSQLQVKGTCPTVPQQRGALSWHGEGMCSPCSCTAVSLSPAQFHMQLHWQLSMATALTDQSHPTRAISSPQLQPQTHSHPRHDCRPMRQHTMAPARLLPWALVGRQG